MLVATGRYNNADPLLKISLGADPSPLQEFEAVIDTGCTGFLSIPAHIAQRLGIVPDHTEQITYADGVTRPCQSAIGFASVGGKIYEGDVAIEEFSIDILLGIDFLRRFKLALFMTSTLILLMDENEVEKMMARNIPSPPSPDLPISSVPPS